MIIVRYCEIEMPKMPRKHLQLYVIFLHWRRKQTQLSIPASSVWPTRFGSPQKYLLILIPGHRRSTGHREDSEDWKRSTARGGVILPEREPSSASFIFMWCFLFRPYGISASASLFQKRWWTTAEWTLRSCCFLTSSVVEKQEIKERLTT